MPLTLFEFEDQPWFPATLRNYQTGFIGFLASHTGLYQAVPELLASAHPQCIVDLASGSGEPAVRATESLRKAGVRLLLTDKYPNAAQVRLHKENNGVTYLPESLNLPKDDLPKGEVYTLFNAFHHFTPSEQLALIQKIHSSSGQLHIFEPLRKDWKTLLKVMASTLIGPLLLTPFIRPFTWSRLLWTYVLPVGIFVTFWDGAVSVLRALSEKDIANLQRRSREHGVSLTHEKLETKLAHITYLRVS